MSDCHFVHLHNGPSYIERHPNRVSGNALWALGELGHSTFGP